MRSSLRLALRMAGLLAFVTAAGRGGQPVRPSGSGEAGPGEGDEKRLLESTFESAPLICLVVDSRSRLVRANARGRERFPFLRQGLTLLEAFSQHLLAVPVAQAIEERRATSFSVRLFADGWRTYRTTVAPFEGGDGACVFLDDTTEETSYQAMRTQFLANVSHELRTPLTGISALLETLADPDLDVPTRERFLARATHETARLSTLISDTLFLAEIETKTEAFEDTCDLAGVCRWAVEAQQDHAAQYDVTVTVEAGAACPAPLPDNLAEMVVKNLVENAIRYSGPGTHAVVRCRDTGSESVLEVADDGIGIDERHLSRIFERFYRVDPSRSREIGGTGLGLSIVKHVAERAGGRAEAVSRPGHGTTIRVTLPRPAHPA